MNKNLQSPTKLTEFAPLQPEEKPQSVGQLISKFFKLNKSNPESSLPPPTTPTTTLDNNVIDDESQDSLPAWAIDTTPDSSSNSEKDISNVYQVDPNDGRTHVNVLKRISNLLALKSSNLQAYSDTELKQYWMPDSVSKECYQCAEKFTTFRRRHHCRVCGQIFCSLCCNQQIPGKIFGCTGDLRVCTYCCKIVLSYLQSNDVAAELSADLKVLQENLQIKYGSSTNLQINQNNLSPNSITTDNLESGGGTLKRKISLAYQEEKFASRRTSGDTYLTAEEKCRALQNSASLRNLYEEIFRTNSGIILQTHRYRLRTFNNCFLGSELVDWLICQQKANTRIQASAISQALLDGGYIESVSEPCTFVDGYSLYKPGSVSSPEIIQNKNEFENPNLEEPSWIQSVPQETNANDSDTEQFLVHHGRITSSSSYTLDLNVVANTVYLSKPLPSNYNLNVTESESERHKIICTETPVVKTSEQRENVPESGWYNASHLREDYDEKIAYDLLSSAFKQHEETLLKQLLSVKNLSLSWSEILIPLVHNIVNVIRPDMNHDAQDINIKQYVHFKKVPSGNRTDCKLIRGIVFSKNVAHKHMSKLIDNPKILLLRCSIVYQRTEGKLMSLEPVLMQEKEYLRHVTARIVALQPDIVLVQRTVARLAQDMLREHGITLVFNVKEDILERLARCTKAELVQSIDAHIGPKPLLGTCKKFYIQRYDLANGCSKTLMCFDGLPMLHLGGTVLLRGASNSELDKIKKVVTLLLFTCYNWRLEKSFLMDEFAQPPNSKDEFFDDSKENSPIEPINSVIDNKDGLNNKRKELEHKQKGEEVEGTEKNDFVKDASTEELFTKIINQDRCDVKNKEFLDKKIITEAVDDFTDPLQSYPINECFDDKVSEKFTVSELPFSNHFRKALDDTILSISPYLVFSIPYLETDAGRKCKLRNFFPSEIYYSKQFSSNVENKVNKENEINGIDKKTIQKIIKPPHPFVTARITSNIIEKSGELQGLLANFRACGGRLEKKPFLKDVNDENNHVKEIDNYEQLDVLEPNNHQRLAVLFYSFSHSSNNAPAFCVYPWVVQMEFYGENDIPLGCFLERYCFRSIYTCQSKTCDTPMLKHIRRFVHNFGCVSISLCNSSELNEDSIVMWSCCIKCERVSPVVPMSCDTWSFSFAKYLELRFHGNVYTRRGDVLCKHSLHHDYVQYFRYKDVIASFVYTPVQLWEISLPPRIIDIQFDTVQEQANMIDEIKCLAQKGHDIFSLINDKLSAMMPHDLEGIANLKTLLAKENLLFKQKIDEVQIKLTSPTLENKIFDANDNKAEQAIWKINDSLIRIRHCIADAVDIWNLRLSDIRKISTDKRKDKIITDLDSPNASEAKPIVSDENAQVQYETNSNFMTKKIKSLDQSDENCTETNNSLENAPIKCPSITDSNLEVSDDSVFISEEVKIQSSPKCHQRSHSDGTVLSQNEDVNDVKKDVDKKLVKNILTQLLLPSQSALAAIPSPFTLQEHHLLPSGVYMLLEVYENELSSIVAYALNSYEYKRIFDEITGKKATNIEQSPSPVHKRKTQSENRESSEFTSSVEKSTGLLSFLRTKDSKNDLLVASTATTSNNSDDNSSQILESSTNDEPKKNKLQQNIEIQFEDFSCNFFCRIYYAEKFARLRKIVLPIGEEAYIRSLSRSLGWNARGGKSGSNFYKTADDRFIIKEIPKNELQIFLHSATCYFTYLEHCYNTGQPTLLGKILGVYQVVYRNSNTNASLRTNLIVMENLFYNRKVTQKFDLKGSMRNRMVNPHNQDGEIVLLDENLLKMTCDSPLYILPHSKAVLTAAIQNDTKFLSMQAVMDYSLLVGLDTENKELVLGIIDYIRTFTWDKKIETIVKKTGILGGQGKLPTIVSPEEYQKRFIQAMHTYFLEVPDPWAGLGKGLEY